MKKCFKCFLKDNKIYFETIMSLLVSVTAIIVSCASLLVAQRQLKVAEIQLLPKFTIYVHQEKSDNNGDFFDQDNIYIENSGGYFRQFSVQAVAKVVVKKSKRQSFAQKKIEKYLWHYYFGTEYNSGSILRPAKIVGTRRNNYHFSNITREYSKMAEDENCFGDIAIIRYIKINYIDSFNNTHEEYYQVDSIRGSYEIDKSLGKKLFEESNNMDYGIDFINATANTFNELIKF